MSEAFRWTEETITRAESLRDQGKSAAQIAEAIGAVSRNAVLGLFFRRRMCERAATRRPVGIHFIAERGQCRRPLWGTKERVPFDRKFVCGAPSGRETYCRECSEKVFGKGTKAEREAHTVRA